MKSVVGPLTFVIVCSLGQSSAAQDQSGRFAPDTETTVLHRELDSLLAAIASEGELDKYVSRLPDASPLLALPAGARRRFLQSLTFGSNGLSGFDYWELEANLNVTQAYRILGLFGVQHIAGKLDGLRVDSALDLEIREAHSRTAASAALDNDTTMLVNGFLLDHKCSGVELHTCDAAVKKACTSNC